MSEIPPQPVPSPVAPGQIGVVTLSFNRVDGFAFAKVLVVPAVKEGEAPLNWEGVGELRPSSEIWMTRSTPVLGARIALEMKVYDQGDPRLGGVQKELSRFRRRFEGEGCLMADDWRSGYYVIPERAPRESMYKGENAHVGIAFGLFLQFDRRGAEHDLRSAVWFRDVRRSGAILSGRHPYALLSLISGVIRLNENGEREITPDELFGLADTGYRPSSS